MFLTKHLRIGGVEYNLNLAERKVRPTAYAPATLTRTRSTGIDQPDPARFTVDVTVPDAAPNLPVNPSFENGTTGWVGAFGTLTATTAPLNAPWPLAGQVGRSVGQLVTADPDSATVYQEGIPVPPDAAFAFRVWTAHQATAPVALTVHQTIRFWTGAAWSDTITGPPTAATSSQSGTYLTVSGPIPTGAEVCEIRLWIEPADSSTLPDGTRLWVDDVRLVTGSSEAHALAAVSFTGPPQLGDLVEVSVVGEEGDSNTSFVGQVESLSRRRKVLRNADGTTFTANAYEVAATDLLGSLARRMIGDEPWPVEQVPDRWNRVRALVPDIPMVERGDYSGRDLLAPRDVDNTSALSVLRDTVAMRDEELYINGDGRIAYMNRNQTITAPDQWEPSAPNPYVRGGAFATVHLPAAAFSDPGDVVDYDLVVNVARVTGKREDPENPGEYADRIVTITNAESRARHGESTWSVSGDGLADGTIVPDVDAMPAARRARRLVDTAGTPAWRLAGQIAAVPHRIAPDDPKSWLTSLMDTGVITPIVMLDGAPVGRDIWRVIGLRATWGSDDVEALELDVEPYEMAGPLGLTFIDTIMTPPLTFELAAPMTFAQARTIDSIGFFE